MPWCQRTLKPMLRACGSLLAAALVVATACGGHRDLNNPCTIGQPCVPLGGDSTVSDGYACRGAVPGTSGGGPPPACECDCVTPIAEAGDDTGSDATPEAEAEAEAGVCGSGPPDACNSVPLVGAAITATCVVGSAPVMMGGTIQDGTYVLVSATAYASSCAPGTIPIPPGGPTTVVFSGQCMQSNDASGGAKTFQWDSAGSGLSLGEVCPDVLDAQVQFTATATTLSELAPLGAGIAVVSVFQKE